MVDWVQVWPHIIIQYLLLLPSCSLQYPYSLHLSSFVRKIHRQRPRKQRVIWLLLFCVIIRRRAKGEVLSRFDCIWLQILFNILLLLSCSNTIDGYLLVMPPDEFGGWIRYFEILLASVHHSTTYEFLSDSIGVGRFLAVDFKHLSLLFRARFSAIWGSMDWVYGLRS